MEDLEGDLVHWHLIGEGVDARMCFPLNPDSKIAQAKGAGVRR